MTGSDAPLHLRTTAIVAARAWRDLLRLSRPHAWPWTSLQFLVGALDAERAVTPAVVIGTFVAAGPVSLAIHGARDAVAARPRIAPAVTWLTIAAVGIPSLVVLAVVVGPASALLLAMAVGVGVGARVAPSMASMASMSSVPTGARMALGLAVWPAVAVLVALGGLLVHGGSASVPWPSLVTLALWAIATGALRRMTTGAPRSLAWIALGSYLLAAVVIVTLGALGVLAAIGLLLYALLPAMILAAGATGADAAESAYATERAWNERRGLDLLVGAWLAFLLLAHWGHLGNDPIAVAIAVPTVLLGYANLNVLLGRLTSQPSPARDGDEGRRDPSLAIVIGDHDEDGPLPATLDAVAAQTYADSRVIRIGRWEPAPPRPPGWGPNGWTRHVAIETTDTDLVLFVGPGTVLDPIAARILVEHLDRRGLDLLSGTPGLAGPTDSARAAAAGPGLTRSAFVPTWWSTLTGGRPSWTALADDAIILVRRNAYRFSLAHAPRSGGPGGGDGLARMLARGGYRVGAIHIAPHAATLPAHSVAEAVRAVRDVTITSSVGLASGIGTVALEAVAFLVPLVLPVAAVVAGVDLTTLALSLVPLALLVGLRATIALIQRQPLADVAWHPLTVAVTLLGRLLAIADHAAGRAGHRLPSAS
ncbi:hypothetical protein BH20CHL7_BH20CHL7_19470 [soil metagenome]